MDQEVGAAANPGERAATTRLECKICWTVYDPALGDEVWQIPPGTPFDALPPYWTCPNCAAEKNKFLVLGEERHSAPDV